MVGRQGRGGTNGEKISAERGIVKKRNKRWLGDALSKGSNKKPMWGSHGVYTIRNGDLVK